MERARSHPTSRTAALLVAAALLAGTAPLRAAEYALKDDLEAAMASDIRTDAERARDANRKPVETLEFFGLEGDMRVLELIPGGGWYTKLLAPVLAENGELFVSIGTTGVEQLLEDGVLEDVTVLPFDGEFTRGEGESRFSIQGLRFPVDNLDMVLTFRNLHNMTPEGRGIINAEVFRTLKPGGLYGVVDHTRRHMQEDNHENRRRLDPVMAIKEIEAAGFEFVDYSTLHYRPDDELVYEVGRRSVTGNTDRFTLLFRKP